MPYLNYNVSIALMRPRRPKKYRLQLIICMYIYRKSASRFSRETVLNTLKQSRINIMRGKKLRPFFPLIIFMYIYTYTYKYIYIYIYIYIYVYILEQIKRGSTTKTTTQ